MAALLTFCRVAALVAACWLAGRLILHSSKVSKAALRIEGNELLVRLPGWDALFALRRGLVVDLAVVHGIRVQTADPVGGLPIWGTSLPGGLRVGTFVVDGRREFWDVRSPGQVLEISLGAGAAWSRLILQVADPQAAALALRPHAATLIPSWL